MRERARAAGRVSRLGGRAAPTPPAPARTTVPPARAGQAAETDGVQDERYGDVCGDELPAQPQPRERRRGGLEKVAFVVRPTELVLQHRAALLVDGIAGAASPTMTTTTATRTSIWP
jgi:hypothetical protein